MRYWLWFLWFIFPAHALTVHDDVGNAITLNVPAQRIVSLAPSITENLFAIGAGERIVGTSTASDYPIAAQNIPIVADYQSVNLEKIAALRPDVIVIWQGGTSPAQISALRQLKIPIYEQHIQTLADIPSALMHLAQLTGLEQSAAPTIISAYQKIPLLSEAAQPPLTVFYQVWYSPLMTINGHSWISDALARCGARNIFESATISAPTVNAETVLQYNPNIIMTSSLNATPNSDLDQWKAWPKLAATQRNGLLFVDADTLNRATLRTLDTAQNMCQNIAHIRHP